MSYPNHSAFVLLSCFYGSGITKATSLDFHELVRLAEVAILDENCYKVTISDFQGLVLWYYVVVDESTVLTNHINLLKDEKLPSQD